MSERLAEQLRYLPDFLSGHLLIAVTALAIGIAVCLPLAVLVTRVKPLQWPTLAFASVMQTVPGIALLALMVPLLGMIGFVPALVALVLYSMLPIVRNTVTGILETDPDLVEAARGLGMTSRQRLLRVELPLAAPVIIAGIRTSAVWVIGTATLSTPVGATSLGNYIFPGLQTQNTTAVLVGSIAAAALAIVLDQLIHLVEVAAARRSRRLGWLAAILLAVLIGGGLSPRWATAGGGDGRPRVALGAKQFTEQYILAEVATRVLEDHGFAVDNRGSLGSTVLFDALAAGTLDCYVDYTGTIWANVLERTDNPPAAAVLEEVARRLARDHGIVCLGALGFENAYALAMRREAAEARGIATLGDLARRAPALAMGTDYDFLNRPEWAALRRAYGLEFGDTRQFDPTLMYRAVAAGQVDVITAYSTDGRILAFDLVLLDDPAGALPPYDAIVLLSERAARDARLVRALETLVGRIDGATMRRANKMVDLDGAPIGEAARLILDRIGTE